MIINIPLVVIFLIGFFLIDVQVQVPITTILMSLVFTVIGLAVFVLTVLAAIKGFQGQIYKIPVIGNLADRYSR